MWAALLVAAAMSARSTAILRIIFLLAPGAVPRRSTSTRFTATSRSRDTHRALSTSPA